ncbi:MAG: hypothetical protein AB8B96_19420 [Lysobacterales bacterium]
MAKAGMDTQHLEVGKQTLGQGNQQGTYHQPLRQTVSYADISNHVRSPRTNSLGVSRR